MNREELRQFVCARAAGRCEYCRVPELRPRVQRFHVEHIIARNHGGTDATANLAWACQRCNELKGPNLGSVDPDSREKVWLFHPREHRWDDHFEFQGLRIVGRTPTGRTTAWLLDFNAEERLMWRRYLRTNGLF
jgi:hypothetical protein